MNSFSAVKMSFTYRYKIHNTSAMAELSNDNHNELLTAISGILLKNGMKSTTMDSIASALSMSKRTLYEIFDSKKDMIIRAVGYWQKQRRKRIESIFASSKTVMEALARTFAYQKKLMTEVNVDFFFDMDEYLPEVRELDDSHGDLWIDKLLYAINLGIEQGVFRPDVNYPFLLRMMRLQVESLRRMDEVFPDGIELSDAFDSIYISFLRSIASQDGMEVIDNFYLQNEEYSNDFITESTTEIIEEES